MLSTQSPILYIVESDQKGRAVFTATDITKGSIIEICPIIILSEVDTQRIHSTKLHDYYFQWDAEQKTSAIALGYGSLYNHSEKPNADFELVKGDNEIHIFAIKDIAAGEEVLIDYLVGDKGGGKLWFSPKE